MNKKHLKNKKQHNVAKKSSRKKTSTTRKTNKPKKGFHQCVHYLINMFGDSIGIDSSTGNGGKYFYVGYSLRLASKINPTHVRLLPCGKEDKVIKEFGSIEAFHHHVYHPDFLRKNAKQIVKHNFPACNKLLKDRFKNASGSIIADVLGYLNLEKALVHKMVSTKVELESVTAIHFETLAKQDKKDQALDTDEVAQTESAVAETAEQQADINTEPKKVDKRKKNYRKVSAVTTDKSVTKGKAKKGKKGKKAKKAKKIKRPKIKTNLLDIFITLIILQILYPSSKSQAVENSNDLVGKYRLDLNLIYETLDVIYANKKEILKCIFDGLKKLGLDDTSVIMIDLSNVFSHCKTTNELAKQGKSKEHVPNPIVQFALCSNKYNIPLFIKLFSGNTADSKALIPTLLEMKETLGVKEFGICIGDKAFNTQEIITFLIRELQWNFLFSSKFRGMTSPLNIRMFIRENSPFKDPNFQLEKDGFTYLSFIGERKLADGTTIEEKVVCVWNHEKAKLERAEREEFLRKAEQMTPTELHRHNVRKYNSKYLTHNITDKQNKAVETKLQLVATVDEEKVYQDSLEDGANVFVTNKVDLEDEAVSGMYNGLTGNEENFRILKHFLKLRPYYLEKPERIEAHFIICYIALLVIRIIEHFTGVKVERQLAAFRDLETVRSHGNKYSFQQLKDNTIEVLKKMGIDLTYCKDRMHYFQVKCLGRNWLKRLLHSNYSNCKIKN